MTEYIFSSSTIVLKICVLICRSFNNLFYPSARNADLDCRTRYYWERAADGTLVARTGPQNPFVGVFEVWHSDGLNALHSFPAVADWDADGDTKLRNARQFDGIEGRGNSVRFCILYM